MKIREIRAVNVKLPPIAPKTPPRRRNWNDYAPRGLPMNKYPEYPPTTPAKTPGIGGRPVWVKVTAEDGSWGLGRCSFGEPVAALVDYHFAPLLEGRDLFATELLNDMMWRSTKRFGSLGLSAVAQSGIDLALWDLKGKLLQQPVYRLIGGPSHEKIRCYCTSDDLDWSLELGFKAFKVSNPAHYIQGIEGIDQVEEKIAQARETVGAHAELMFNPVMAFDVEFTIRLAERLRPYQLRWLEEPLIPEDLEGHMQIRRAITWIPLATGEDHHTRIPFRQLVENRCVDVVQPDLHWCGGMTEALKIYAIAEAAGIKSSPHGGCNSPFGQHFCYAMPECVYGEFHLSSPVGVPLAEVNRIPGMAVPKDGYLVPSDAPGFGMEIKGEWIVPWDHSGQSGESNVAVL
ncbi:MAG TPA: mandelate racemase/muconate lactonizing enzyme family protein [Chloroflexota bacterium]|nr:mandelate racemase/muconate lactonizing enzyme family protein [Chloroflexota bacterium]